MTSSKKIILFGGTFDPVHNGHVRVAEHSLEQLQADAAALPLDGLGLDFYHLSENVHRCRREVFGAENAPGEAWSIIGPSGCGKTTLLNPNWVEDVRSGKALPLYKSEEANIAYTDTPLP